VQKTVESGLGGKHEMGTMCTVCITRLNVQKLCVFPTRCIDVFCMDLKTNSDHFSVQHLLLSFVTQMECGINKQHYALNYITSCFDSSLPSSGSFLDPCELLEQIGGISYKVYVACVPECCGSVRCASQLSAYTQHSSQ
jgi:hypothetical protein